MSGTLLSLGATLVAITVAQAAPFSVGELLSDPDRFRGQLVTVSGTMSHFRERVTYRGKTPCYTFDFGDGAQIVRVISYEKPWREPPPSSLSTTTDGVQTGQRDL